MALLHYINLGVHRPDILMSRSVQGLKIFYDFLTRTKRYMESDSAVLRLAWRKGDSPGNATDDKPSRTLWVRLVEPEDRPNEPEATFRSFLDENVKKFTNIVRTTNNGKPLDFRIIVSTSGRRVQLRSWTGIRELNRFFSKDRPAKTRRFSFGRIHMRSSVSAGRCGRFRMRRGDPTCLCSGCSRDWIMPVGMTYTVKASATRTGRC